jgi:hypothetical protein
MRRKREVEFRPYTKESLLAREVEIFAGEDDEETLSDGVVDSPEAEDGMHAVDDETEPLDFVEPVEAEEDEDDDDDDDS